MTHRIDGAAELQEETMLYQLVAVGSSAGGIEALSTLVATLPSNFPAPLVLAQHLDPTYPSHLGEILARRSTLPVRTVTHQEPLLPGVVYVVPADRHVEITDHIVRLRTSSEGRSRGPKPSVDRLLTTAARVYGERLIAVILTGTGSDGAAGARAVKAAGGLVLIENPATATYAGMPESLAPTTVDLVADLARIGPLLADLMTTPSPRFALGSSRDGSARTEAKIEVQCDESALQTILAQVLERSGIDFNRYKRPTILRRLQRLAASLEQQSEASEAARAQLEAILLSMGDALLVVDRNGVPILTNAAYVRLFGSADARVVAQDEEGQPLPLEQQPNYLAVRGAAFRLRFSLRASDGTRRWFEASGEPVHSGSVEHGGVITIRDITDLRLSQR